MRKSLTISNALTVIGCALAMLASTKPAFAGDQLSIVSWGGALQAAERKAWFEPFTKATGIKITEDEYNGEVAKVRAMVTSKTVSWDVVNGYNVWVEALCSEGILERIDWKKLGLDRSKFMDGDKSDCGVPGVTSGTVIAYDKGRFPNGPTRAADLFDTKKFPGKRGLWKSPAGNLERALIADGVALNDVYKVLRTPAGVDRAFRKLDTIKNDVIWWTAGAQPPQLLADGQVVMTTAYNGRIYDAMKNSGKNFGVVWEAATWSVGNVWVIPKGTPRLDDAYKFIAFAASPQAQGNLTRYIPYGPANKDAMAHVDAAVLPDLMNSPEHLRIVLKTDAEFWNEKGDELRQRFNAWLAKSN